jgi:hypothetical protein
MLRRLPAAGLLAAAAIAAPVAATAPAATAPGAARPGPAASPFTADRASSLPLGLVPDDVSKPFAYPDEPIVLSWSAVPGAVSYRVQVSSNAAFTDVVWSTETDQAQVAPDVLLPDGTYYWRVTATDAAGTIGLTSAPARFAKTWPARISGLKTAATPTGAAASQIEHQPYLSWNPLPGATEYEVQIAAGDQFGSPILSVAHDRAPFDSPATMDSVLPDDTYQWRVRARDPKGNPGPWSTPVQFTKAWQAAEPVFPADDATVSSLFFRWKPVPGAERYEVQVTDTQHTFQGAPLKVNTTTANTELAVTWEEEKAKGLSYGNLWWRVRPVVNGVYGGWSPARHITYQAPTTTTNPTVLSPAADSDSALMPYLQWTPVTGATMYRVDIATDPLFHNVVESAITSAQAWAPRLPLPDNQVGTGYYWRVVWGSGASLANPQWMVDETTVPVGHFTKQTRVSLGPASGSQVADAPLLSWSPVDGVARYELQLSRNPLFDQDTLGGAEVDRATIWGLGAVPGSHRRGAPRLADGTWYWRVRAIDGAGNGQSWSPVGRFTLTSPRPSVSLPGDGETVVGAPLMRWSPVAQACGYEVQVSKTPSFGDDAALVSTAQTAIVLTGKEISRPGRWYWRVRADYCGKLRGQWTPTRSFRSVRPPDFGLNSIPAAVPYGGKIVVSGALSFGGARVRRPLLVLERRVWPQRDFRFFGTVRGDANGRFAFRLAATRTAAYSLRWVANAGHPEGQAPFAVRVLPRVSFVLGSDKVVRRGHVMVRGSVYPRRRALVQVKTASGWETIRTLTLHRSRFGFRMPATLVPGRHRLRVFVPGDRRLAAARSATRRLFVYDRFVVRGRR